MLKIKGRCRVCGNKVKNGNRFCDKCSTPEIIGIDHLFSKFSYQPIGWGYDLLKYLIQKDPRLVLIKARRGGFKTVFADLYALYRLVYFNDFIVFASISGDVANENIRFLRRQIRNSVDINEIVRTTEKKQEIEFSNGGRILAIPQSETSRAGYHPDLLIIDEAARMKSDFYYSTLRGMVVGEGKEILLSTPFGSSSFFGEIYHKPPKDTKIFDIGVKECWWFSKEDLKTERERAPSIQLYNQESLGLFQGSINRVFSDSDIKDAKVDKINWVDKGLIMGVDFARKTDYTAITIYDSIRQTIVFCDRIPKSVDIWEDKLNLIRDLYKTYNIARIYADATGIGDVLIESLSDLPIEGVIFTQNSKVEMYNRLQLLFKNRIIKFTENDELEKELENFIFYDDTMRKMGPAFVGAHDDLLDSLVLAVKEAQPIFGGTTQSSWSRVIY